MQRSVDAGCVDKDDLGSVVAGVFPDPKNPFPGGWGFVGACPLYTLDAADDRQRGEPGCRWGMKKKHILELYRQY